MNKLLLLLLLLTADFLVVDAKETPETIFLKELQELTLTYGTSTMPLRSGPYKPVISDERKAISLRYALGLPKLWLGLQTMVYQFLNLNGSFRYKKTMLSYLSQNPALSPAKLLKFFKPLIMSRKFNIQTGDIVMILPHSYSSLIRAYMMDSAYSHNDIIFINKNNIPQVFSITPYGVIKISLARYLCGYFKYMNNFAIYRYNKKFDKQLLHKLMNKIDIHFNNLYFDEPFVRNTKINNVSSFMEKPTFYYCTELSYALYSFVLKNENFTTTQYVSVEQMIKNREIKTSPIQDFFINYAKQMETNQQQWIIDPKNFYQSPDFSSTTTYGNTISIKDKFNAE